MAIASIRENRMPFANETARLSAAVDLHVPALFPSDYLGNTHTRLMLYKRIAGAADLHELEELQIEPSTGLACCRNRAKTCSA